MSMKVLESSGSILQIDPVNRIGSKEKDMMGKENRAPQGGVRNVVDNLRAAINRGVAEIAADNIGERFREGVQRRLREHALQRQQATLGASSELEILDCSKEEESPVTPRQCLEQFCQQPSAHSQAAMLDNKESDNKCEMGTMEAGAGVGGSKCEKMYKQYGNSVQYLLIMSIGLKNKKGRELAGFHDDPIYKAYLQKSL
jgi:hypothetical protein